MSDWYYVIDQQAHGPLTEAEMRAHLESGQISPDTYIREEAMNTWHPASEMKEFYPQPEAAPVHLEFATAAPEPVHGSTGFPVVLTQRSLLGEKQVFKLVSDQALKIKLGAGKKALEKMVAVGTLLPDPQRFRKTGYLWFILALPFSVVMCGFLGWAVHFAFLFDWLTAGVLFGIALIFALPVLGLLYLFYRKSENLLVFMSREGTHLTLWHNNPDKEAFTEFVTRLEGSIAKSKAPRKKA